MAKVDLSGLKKEIENRKSEKNLSVGITESGSPRDIFLNSLMTSLKTGRSTPATKLLEMVENTIPDAMNIAPITETHLTQAVNQNLNHNYQRTDNSGIERDDLLFEKFGKANKKTLAESLEEFSPSKTPNFGNQQNFNTVAFTNVESMVNEALSKNLELLLDDAVKSTIIEMYSTERIKQVIKENPEMIRSIVINVIKELQQKNKK
jgi:hypothetical protein